MGREARAPPFFDTHVRWLGKVQGVPYKNALFPRARAGAKNPARTVPPTHPLISFIHTSKNYNLLARGRDGNLVGRVWGSLPFSFELRCERGQKQLGSREVGDSFLCLFFLFIISSGCSPPRRIRELLLSFGRVPESPRLGSFPGVDIIVQETLYF